MNHEYDQHRARPPATATTHNNTVEPGQSSRSALLHKPVHAIASGLVQRKGGGDSDEAAVHAAAARGVATTSSPLPHADVIQRAFGRHDISSIQAHTGPEAAASADAMGAQAYATGNHVVLGGSTDLHTVAHEAAHVVQQRGGVQLKGGVGAVGDAYERHADAVADTVVRGEYAGDLLDKMAEPDSGASAAGPNRAPSGTGHVQRMRSPAQVDDGTGAARRLIAEYQARMTRDHGTTETDVTPIAPNSAPYVIRTVDISNKAPQGGRITVDDRDVKQGGDVTQREGRNHVLFREMTGKRFDFIFVVLPKNTTSELLSTPVHFAGKDYRIDLFGGSFVKSGRALGIEAGAAEGFKQLLGYEESVTYALRALFPQVIAGVEGTIRGRTYPINSKGDPEGKALTFTLRDGKTEVQVNDGWGYIKNTLANKMQAHGLTREKREPEPGSGNAGYQMMQWLNKVQRSVINELVANGKEQWVVLTQEAATLQRQLEAGGEDRFKIEKAIFENTKKRYSLLTTGRPRMETATAMPVAGNNLVLPHGSERFADMHGGGVSLMRSPADKPNWRPIPAENVEHDGDRSKFLAGMEAIQYSWTGLQGDFLTFCKGMVGVIPEGNWPQEWDGVDIVVTSDDRKLYERWHAEQDRKETRSMGEDFTMQGSLVAGQWMAPGTVVGVPNDAQKWLGGDYDGDEVSILSEKRNPLLHKQITNEYREEQINPKLPKTFTNNPEGSRADRLMAMRSKNVTMWSDIAAKLCAMEPKERNKLAQELYESNIVPTDERASHGEEAAMWLEVGKGIKIGTDGFKTSVPVAAYETRAGFYQQALTKRNLYPLPYQKELMTIIERAGQPTLTNGAWRNVYFSAVNRTNTGNEAPLWGVPNTVLAMQLRQLFPAEELTDAEYERHQREWQETERGR